MLTISQLSNSKYALWAEVLGLYIGLPFLLYLDMVRIPKIVPLFLATALCSIYLYRDSDFDNRQFGLNDFRNWKMLLGRTLVVFLLMTLTAWLFIPDALFNIPQEKPMLWLAILVFYPIWSAYTQELLYRGFFFHRYGQLFSSQQQLFLVNAICFGFVHIIFENWLAVVGTFFISFVFAHTYQRSKSLIGVGVEHGLYGNLVFTVGFGEYFYKAFTP